MADTTPKFSQKRKRATAKEWADSREKLDAISRVTTGAPAPIPNSLTEDTYTDDYEIYTRINGYLDCLYGLVEDGIPDPAYIEYLCEQVGRPVPGPYADPVLRALERLHELARESEEQV